MAVAAALFDPVGPARAGSTRHAPRDNLDGVVDPGRSRVTILGVWSLQAAALNVSAEARIGIVALARKLMVALWRDLTEDLIPEGSGFA